MSELAGLVALLREEGGLVADTVVEPQPGGAQLPSSPAAVAAAGPRTRERAGAYELVLEAIYEGYLLHYGGARVVHTADADLALLAGDRLYALGLARLVELGDIAAVAELADVISLTALAHARGDAPLADAVWDAGARSVGWGGDDRHERAKRLARSGAPEARAALREFAAGT